MARDLADLAESFGRVATAIPKAQRSGLEKAALHVKTVIREELVKAVGADRKMSNVRGRTVLDAGYKIKGSGNGLIAEITPRGFYWKWVEEGTGAHQITPKGRRRTRRGNTRSGSKALKIDGGFYAKAVHRGTSGKHPYAKGIRRAGPEIPVMFQEAVRQTFLKEWK